MDIRISKNNSKNQNCRPDWGYTWGFDNKDGVTGEPTKKRIRARIEFVKPGGNHRLGWRIVHDLFVHGKSVIDIYRHIQPGEQCPVKWGFTLYTVYSQ